MRQNTPPAAIIVYSRTGKSHDLASALGKRLGVTPTEVSTRRYTWPFVSWFSAGYDSARAKSAPLDQAPTIREDDLVILVGPVWVGGVATPLNTVIDTLRARKNRVAAFLTCTAPQDQPDVFSKLEQRLGRPLIAAQVMPNGLQGSADAATRIDVFVDACLETAEAS